MWSLATKTTFMRYNTYTDRIYTYEKQRLEKEKKPIEDTAIR